MAQILQWRSREPRADVTPMEGAWFYFGTKPAEVKRTKEFEIWLSIEEYGTRGKQKAFDVNAVRQLLAAIGVVSMPVAQAGEVTTYCFSDQGDWFLMIGVLMFVALVTVLYVYGPTITITMKWPRKSTSYFCKDPLYKRKQLERQAARTSPEQIRADEEFARTLDAAIPPPTPTEPEQAPDDDNDVGGSAAGPSAPRGSPPVPPPPPPTNRGLPLRVWIAPAFGRRYHVERLCDGLRKAKQVQEYDQCRICCA